MSQHQSEVSYTNSDDGLWITCKTCRKTSPSQSETFSTGYVLTGSALGYSPSVEALQEMWAKHLAGEW